MLQSRRDWQTAPESSSRKQPVEISQKRRVRARSLHDFLGNRRLCKPGVLTGRAFLEHKRKPVLKAVGWLELGRITPESKAPKSVLMVGRLVISDDFASR
jgi:hypothetical protein